jgi:hypothetical protein
MNQNLQKILHVIQQNEKLSEDEKNSLLKSLKDADKELEITAFKLERTEKVKKTTAILLEETIEELEQKRKAVEEQNRELEIETTLEKVRTIAMGMSEPADMLDVCKTISFQLQSLGVKEIRNVQTAIFYEQRGTYMNYEYYAKHDKTFITETVYTNNNIHNEFATKMLRGKGETFITHIKDNEVKNWIAYQKTTNVFIDKYLEAASSLNYYWFSLGPVALGISTYVALTENEIYLFKRFLKVFELAYQRYLDIEKAEAQAREARIEASLERVRAVAMSMNKSEDLLSICEVSFKEFKKLGFDNIRNALIHIQYDEQKYFMDYDFSDLTGGAITKIEYGSHPVVEEYLKQIKGAKDAFYQGVIKEDQLEEWKNFRKNSGQIDDPRLDNATALYYYFFSVGVGDIGISTLQPIDESQIKILKRFRNVFNLSYQRYSDIAQAEELAREAQIEAALERVRAVAMGMNKPDDLLNICEVMFKELKSLRFNKLRNTLISTYQDDKDYFDEYDYSDASGGYITKIPYSSHPVLERFQKQIWRTTEAFEEFIIEEDQLNDWKEHRRSNGEPDDPRLENISVLYYYFYSIGPASIGISTFDSISEEMREVLKRFRNVFSLSYQRYTDIALAEAQAREAQIEAALEKVRAVAMSMNKPDDLLNICEALFKEFQKLGFGEMRNAMINIHNDEKRTFTNYDYSDQIGKSINHLTYNIHPVIEKQIKQIRSANDAFSETSFTGKDLEEWKKFRKKIGEKDDPRINEISALYYYFYSIGTGSIGISTFNSINEEKLELLKRFRNVFSLSYQRYSDIALAEAQAREAQIELALERVRARTMAMQSSNELVDTSTVLFHQLKNLGVDSIRTGVATIDEVNETVEVWSTSGMSENFEKKILGVIPANVHPMFAGIFNSWKNKEPFFSYELKGDELKKYYKTLSSYLSYPEQKEFNEREMIYTFFFPEGSLNVVSHDILKEEECSLTIRFAKVFGLVYTRFLDLQKAEAQAREAQIELALERIRARTMAMHKSEELSETAFLLFQQFTELGHHPDQFTIGIINEVDNVIEFWHTWQGNKMDSKTYLSIDEPHVANKIYTSWKKQLKSTTIDLSGKELKEYNKYRKERLTEAHADLGSDFLETEKRRVINIACFSRGIISISTGQPVENETVKLLERFARMFEQTYTRFLDLQKAEAQAKEAQIEAALERVRSRSIGMQKSEELREVIQVIHDQLIHLNFEIDAAGFTLDYHQNNDWNTWIANKSESLPSLMFIPYIDHPQFNYYKSAKENGLDFLANTLSFEDKNSIFSYMFEFMGDYPQAEKDELLSKPGLAISQAFLKNISLWIYNLDAIPYSEEDNSTLMRFAKVFEQTYTRFNDLQKAEAQARESQIQLALERVRAKTMAMQKSDELKEVVASMFDGMKSLGVDPTVCNIALVDRKTCDTDVWTAHQTDNGMITYKVFISHFEHPFRKKMLDSFLDEIPFSVHELSGDLKKSYAQYLFEHVDYSNVPAGVAKSNEELANMEDGIVLSAAYMKYGLLIVSRNHAISNDESDILQRFAKIFQQTYTRFLDLQKAEAQAREAEIQLALERVRARSLAMHNTSELQDVVNILSQQLHNMNMDINGGVFIAINDEVDIDIPLWASGGAADYVQKVTVPFLNNPVFIKLRDAIKRKNNFFTEEHSQEDKISLFEHFFKYPPWNSLSQQRKQELLSREGGYTRSVAIAQYTSISITNHNGNKFSDDDNEILKRFGNVFEQSYIRFLDLQKAEAQAREAKIETSMEKIRSRSLAMQKPEELLEVAELLRKEMGLLGVEELETSSIYIVDKEKQQAECWYAIKDIREENKRLVSDEMTIMLHDTWVGGEMWKFYKSKKEQTSIVMKGDNRKEWINYCADKSQVLQGYYGSEIPERTYHLVKFNGGYMGAASPGDISSESWDLLKRTAAVFSLAYTRFKDLQDAEARAREAQIEAALERVRSRTMGMQKSDELKEVIKIVFQQLNHLKINLDHAGFVVDYKPGGDWHFWIADERDIPSKITHPYFESVWADQFNEAKEKGLEFFTTNLNFEEKNKFYNELLSYVSGLPQASKDFYLSCPGLAATTVLFDNVSLYIENFSGIPYSDEENNTLIRFGKVFQQTYTRFLDLQKAEAQAREAQIEAALERVRAKAMAMNSSEDLAVTVDTFFLELNKLNIIPHRCGVGIVDRENRIADIRATAFTKENISKKIVGKLKLAGHPVLDKIFESWKLQQEYHPVLKGNEISEYYKVMNPQVEFPDFADDEIQYGHYFQFKEGGVFAWTDQELKEEYLQIFRKYTSVLSLTYRRYSELKEAEAQAREAKIETALERVRSKAMAMHSPNDLAETVNVFFKELKTLGIIPIRCGVGQIDEATRTTSLTTTTSSQQGESFQVIGKVKQTGHPVLDGIFDHWKLQKEYFPVLEGEDIKTYYDVMNPQIGYPEYPHEVTQYGNNFPFKEGFVFAWTESKLSEEELQIFRRFTSVLSLTYRRYMDLKEAEAQAREAKIEASLEKVRSKTMAMQSSDELADTAAVVFQQLINLGIEPNRIYITIIKDEAGFCEFWITDEDGTKVSSAFKANLNENHSFKKMYEGWKENKKSITIDMYGEELQEYFRHPSKLNVPFKDGLSQKRRMQYIAYFSKGFIGVASPDETKPETIQLLERFAAVFNLTYTRFNDLKQAEAQNKIIQAENERKTKELEEARQLQLAMLPKSIPEIQNLDIAVYMKTATEVGGDYYDFKVQENGVLNIGIGDATGHGLQAGTMITLMKGFFTSDVARFSPQKFLEHCNSMIRDIKLGRILMSFSHLRFENKRLIISSAGMPPIYYHHKKNNRTEEIIIQGMPLGAMQSSSYKIVEKELNGNDTILLLTDGLPEQMNSNKVIFDYSRVLKYFDEIAENTPDDIIKSFVKKADEWMNGTAQADDITFIVIKVK